MCVFFKKESSSQALLYCLRHAVNFKISFSANTRCHSLLRGLFHEQRYFPGSHIVPPLHVSNFALSFCQQSFLCLLFFFFFKQ